MNFVSQESNLNNSKNSHITDKTGSEIAPQWDIAHYRAMAQRERSAELHRLWSVARHGINRAISGMRSNANKSQHIHKNVLGSAFCK